MGWQSILVLVLGAVLIVGGLIAFLVAEQRERFISNRELNAHRITPRFNVGGDAK